MLEEAMLREQFQELLGQEKRAAAAYEKLASSLSDAALREQVRHLCSQKHRHIRLVERLLEIVQ